MVGALEPCLAGRKTMERKTFAVPKWRASRLWGLAVGLALLSMPAFAETRTFDLAGFDGVSASSGIHVLVDVGEGFSVVAESDDEVQLDRLTVDVRRGTLRMRMDEGLLAPRRTRGWRVTVRVALPALIHADASSGASVEIDDMEGESLELVASSGAHIEADTLSGTTISAVVSSGSQISVGSGECDTLDAVASDGSTLSLSGVTCSAVDAVASSGASVLVHADESLDANASSGATITVHGGHEKIAINASSGGSIVFP